MKSRCVIHVFQDKITFLYLSLPDKYQFQYKKEENITFLLCMTYTHIMFLVVVSEIIRNHHCQWYLGPEFKCLWYKKLFKWGYPFPASFLFTSRHTGDFYLYILNSFQVTLLYSKYWVSGKWLELRTSTNKSWKDHPRVNKETTNFY